MNIIFGIFGRMWLPGGQKVLHFVLLSFFLCKGIRWFFYDKIMFDQIDEIVLVVIFKAIDEVNLRIKVILVVLWFKFDIIKDI